MNTLSNTHPAKLMLMLLPAHLAQGIAAKPMAKSAAQCKTADLSLADISDASRRATAKGGLKLVRKG